jgi:hypothetical protein
MRLSPTTGKSLMGVGSGTISIDGVPPPSLSGYAGGGWGWLDDDTCGGQAFIAGLWHLKQLVVSTDTLTDLVATTSAGDLAHQFRAGNGEWARFVAGGGIHSSAGLGLTLPLAALGDMDPLGRVAVVQNYAADNGLVTYAANGAQLQVISTKVLAGTERLRTKDGVMAYQEPNLSWHLRDIASGALAAFAPRTDETIAQTVPISISGAIWVVEISGTKITLRPATSAQGYVLSTSPNLFNPDAVSLSAGTVRVAWSITTAENPTALRLADVNTTSAAFVSGSTASGSLVLTSEPDLTQSSLPVGPVEGGGGAAGANTQPRYAIKAEPFVGGEDGKRTYQRYWDQIATAAFAPPDLSQATGVLDPDHGGTGGTGGLVDIDGANILPGTIPCSAMVEDCSLAAGYWAPLTDGDPVETDLIFANADAVMVFVPVA